MMFDKLTDRFQTVFKKLRGYGKITESNISDAMREVKIALLEADVNFQVVKAFIERIKQKAIGEDVLKSITPGQQIIKIVHDELIELLGKNQTPIHMTSIPPTVIMMVGLQGSGKTTTVGKLARKYKSEGYNPLLVAADVQRPAAREQLKFLGDKLGVHVFVDAKAQKAESVCVRAHQLAKEDRFNPVLIDTAGRLHIDEQLMKELVQIKSALKPHEVILVADAMTGQDAVTMAKEFDGTLGVDSIILTKLDGDARGGAALSIHEVTGKPIKFIGIGEKLDSFEPFHPDRMASRILGMGDILSLVEKAQAVVSEEQARELEKKLQQDSYTLDDFRQQLRQIKRMGSLTDLIKLIPGADKLGIKNAQIDEKRLVIAEAIINSMTPEERKNSSIINTSRKERIATGSGLKIQEVNQLLRQFEMMKKSIRQMQKKSLGSKANKSRLAAKLMKIKKERRKKKQKKRR
ncbi:MAG: signal recognition particle protein [bacterium]